MDSKRKYSYANLFNLEPLMNFQLPKQDEDFDYYGNSSQDESRGSRGEHVNGIMSERALKKKKRRSGGSSDEEETGSYSPYISEDRYRAMLGDHIQKYKRRLNYSSQSPASARAGTTVMKNNVGLKDQKITNDSRGGLHKLESTSDFLNGSNSQKLGNYPEADFGLQYGAARPNLEPAFLDIGDGITYRIPLPYEKLSSSLNLPSMSDIRVEEFYLKGTLDLGSLAAMMASDSRFQQRISSGMGDSKPQYESLQVQWTGDAGGIIINGTEYKLKQCHWHTPAEHRVRGQSFNMELHMVHNNSQGQIAVVGILYVFGHPDAFLEKFLPRDLNSLSEEGTDLGVVNPRDIKLGSRKYFRYIGSLTVPPCTEGVIWTVLKKVRTVSREQVRALRNAVHDGFEDNARPIQHWAGRTVYMYRPGV